jgi:hypothetical protein
VEESHYKPGVTVTAAPGHWASRVLGSGKDPTGCGQWSYICLGNNDKTFNAPFSQAIILLDFDVVFRTDHQTFLIDIIMDGFFGSATEMLPAQ